MQTDNSNEPKIVGFESKPIQPTNTTQLKTFALIGVGIIFAIFLFCVPTIDVASPHDNQKKYVSPRKSQTRSAKSAKEQIQEVQDYVDRNMRETQQMLESIRH